VLCLGVPTTANYLLVATLMAPVVVELGAQSGLIIPLIAVHLFVFYWHHGRHHAARGPGHICSSGDQR